MKLKYIKDNYRHSCRTNWVSVSLGFWPQGKREVTSSQRSLCSRTFLQGRHRVLYMRTIWESNSWPTCHTFKSEQKRCLVRLLIVPSHALSNAFLIEVQQFAAVARKQCSICCDIVWVWVETEKILLSTKSFHTECNNWIHTDFMDLITFIPTETDCQRSKWS